MLHSGLEPRTSRWFTISQTTMAAARHINLACQLVVSNFRNLILCRIGIKKFR